MPYHTGGPPTNFTGLFAAPSAATDWEVFNNTAATTTTSLLPSTLAGVGLQMIHVTTTGVDNGLEQVFLPPNTGPAHASASVWVFVNAGRVGLGIGNGGNTSLTAFGTATGQWELLQTVNAGTQTPANESLCVACASDRSRGFLCRSRLGSSHSGARLAGLVRQRRGRIGRLSLV
jgi:hypothetical protein